MLTTKHSAQLAAPLENVLELMATSVIFPWQIAVQQTHTHWLACQCEQAFCVAGSVHFTVLAHRATVHQLSCAMPLQSGERGFICLPLNCLGDLSLVSCRTFPSSLSPASQLEMGADSAKGKDTPHIQNFTTRQLALTNLDILSCGLPSNTRGLVVSHPAVSLKTGVRFLLFFRSILFFSYLFQHILTRCLTKSHEFLF